MFSRAYYIGWIVAFIGWFLKYGGLVKFKIYHIKDLSLKS